MGTITKTIHPHNSGMYKKERIRKQLTQCNDLPSKLMFLGDQRYLLCYSLISLSLSR